MYEVTKQEMNQVYEEMKTPVKHGMVIVEEGANIDCPNVFRIQKGLWGMLYVRHVPGVEREGYETWLATSEDLFHWDTKGLVLAQKREGWDCLQADGGMCLIDHEWGGSMEVRKQDGKYFITYMGGCLPGYEPDPIQMGLAYSETLTPGTWTQLDQPILRQDDADARPFERKTLYKSCVIYDKDLILGHPYIMYYNAKQEGPWMERIGMAVSDNMMEWKRYGESFVLEHEMEGDKSRIAGDPQIIRYGDLWVMHYFVAHSGTAYDTFACSKDLIHWTKWDGPNLIEPSEDYDSRFAHKPFVLKHDGVVYHFYCAVGSQGRGIALATSRA